MFAKMLAVLFAVPFLAQFASADNTCTRNYTVKAGDICDSISAANSVSTYQLAVVNEGIINEECNNLIPDFTLCLGWAGQDCTDTYVVQLGDTCDHVSSMKNINETMFYLNNPQLDAECTNLYVGEVVCVASSVVVPPVPSSPVYGSIVPPTATPADSDLPYCD